MFDDKKDLPSSNKFYMLRLQGGKLLTSQTLTYLGEFDSDVTFGIHVYEIYIQKDLEIKELSTTIRVDSSNTIKTVFNRSTEPFVAGKDGTPSDYSMFTYNPKTGHLKLGSRTLAPVLLEQHATMLEYYVCLTQFTGKRAPLNIVDGEDVYWAPRLPKGAEFGFSQSNNIFGFLTTTVSSVDAKNNDLYFNDFFGANDSFNNREVKVWKCIDSVESAKYEYSGVIKSASINDQQVTFEVNDFLETLNEAYYGGHESFKYFYDMHNGGTYNISENDREKPITRLIGQLSPYDVYWYDTAQKRKTRFLNPEKMLSAVCVSYNPETKNTSTNRKWSCGFGDSNSSVINSTVSTVFISGDGTYLASMLQLNTYLPGRFQVGDTFKLGTEYGIVSSVDRNVTGTQLYVWPRNVNFFAGTIERHKVSAVVIIQNNVTYYPYAGRDYNCSIGANGDMQITFNNNFEANWSGFTPINPDDTQIFFRMHYDYYDARASVVTKNILSDSDIPVSANFQPSQAFPWPDPNVSLVVPFLGDSNFPSFQDVASAVLKSSLSMLYFDNNGELRYRSLLDTGPENTSGHDVEDGLNQSNSKNFSASFDFYDQYVGSMFNFPNFPSRSDLNLFNVSVTDFSPHKTLLYRTTNLYKVDSYLDLHDSQMISFGGARTPTFLIDYNDVMTGRRCEINLESFSRHFDLNVGDSIRLERLKIAGENSIEAKVMGVSQKINETTLKLTDLKRFPQS